MTPAAGRARRALARPPRPRRRPDARRHRRRGRRVGPLLLPDPLAQPCVLTVPQPRAEPRAPLRHRRPEPRRAVPGGDRRPDLARGGGPRRGALGHPRRGGRDSWRATAAARWTPRSCGWWTRRSPSRGSSCSSWCSRCWEQMPLAVLILLIGATGWFGTGRLVRGEVLRLREESVRARRRGARREPAADYVPPPAAEHRRPAAGRGDARRRRRDPARGGPLLSRPRRPAADAVVGRHDPRREAGAGRRAVGRPLPRPRHRHHRAGRQPASATRCATPSIPEAHDPSPRRREPPHLLPRRATAAGSIRWTA